MRTLLVTNDYPPRQGGIQTYLHGFASRLPPDELVVLASTYPGAAHFDGQQAHPVVRAPTRVLLPTPETLRLAREVAVAEQCDRVWFGASAPLGLLARPLALERAVACTHGHEVIWAAAPGTRQLLSRIARAVDVATYLGEYTHEQLHDVMAGTMMAHLPSGVDTSVFRPGAGGAEVRTRLRLSDRPVVVCVSRLVPRKGQDVLIRALPLIRLAVPGTTLLLVGGGPDGPRLRELAAGCGVADDVVFTGSVPVEELPAHYDAGDVFAMPCRSRFGGLEVEGLGIVFLEAAATGLPVVAGRSGGSPDTVVHGQTGYVVRGQDVSRVADRVISLLANPEHARAMGAAGRAWVEREWRWDALTERLRGLLSG